MASDHSSVTLHILLSQSPGCQTAPRMQKLITNVSKCIKINLFLTIINVFLMSKKKPWCLKLCFCIDSHESKIQNKDKNSIFEIKFWYLPHIIYMTFLFMNAENLFSSNLQVNATYTVVYIKHLNFGSIKNLCEYFVVDALKRLCCWLFLAEHLH